MGLGNHPDTSLRRIGQELGEGNLPVWVKMNLGLLEIDQLLRFRCQQSNNDRQGLRDAEANVGDVDEIFGAITSAVGKSSDEQLYLGVVNTSGIYLPREPKRFQRSAKGVNPLVPLHLPLVDDACNVVLEGAWKPCADC